MKKQSTLDMIFFRRKRQSISYQLIKYHLYDDLYKIRVL
jgi:hypothetical protein